MNDLLPPHAAAAEKSLIGAVLRDPDVLTDVRTVVSSGSFYLDAHQKLFAGICAIRDSGRTVDCVTLHDHLRSDKTLADVGGAGYIADLYTSSASGALAVSHAKIVRGMALLRALIHTANTTLRECYEPVRDPEEVLAVVESQVTAVRRSFEQSADSTRLVRDVLIEVMGKIDDRAASGSAIQGVPTGYHDLDLKLRGLRNGELVIIGARPSLGKTALALNFASNAAMGGLGVLVFSLEMPSTDLGERLLAMHSGVSMHRLADARSLTADQMDRLAHAGSTAGFGGCNLWLDDRPDLTVSKLEATARRVVAKHGVSLVVVDYLQLMRPESNRVNRVLQIEEQTRRVKLLARELGVPIVLLSQLSRASEKENREPNLSDLRDCGSIEQDADRVLFLHRGNETPDDGEVWAITVKIAKNRNGPTGNVTLSYHRALMKYHNFAGHHGESE